MGQTCTGVAGVAVTFSLSSIATAAPVTVSVDSLVGIASVILVNGAPDTTASPLRLSPAGPLTVGESHAARGRTTWFRCT